MLTETECQQIKEKINHYPYKNAASLEALKIVQQWRGWVSDEDLRSLAELLDMTTAELEAVATFYNLIFRKPVGRHILLLCDSISCWIMGSNRIREHLTSQRTLEMGKTDSQGRFTLLPIVCLGACDKAPTMMIDQDLYGNLTPEKVDQTLERYE